MDRRKPFECASIQDVGCKHFPMLFNKNDAIEDGNEAKVLGHIKPA